MVALFIFVPLIFLPSYLLMIGIDWYSRVNNNISTFNLTDLYSVAFMVRLGHFGPLVVNITHTRHRSNIFHLVPKLVSKLSKNGGPFFKLQPAPKKTPSTHPSEKHFVHCCGQPAFSKIQSTARTLTQILCFILRLLAHNMLKPNELELHTYISFNTRRRLSLVKLDLKLGSWIAGSSWLQNCPSLSRL